MAEDKGHRWWWKWKWCRSCNDSEAVYDNLRLIGSYEDGEDDIESRKRHLMHPDIMMIFPLKHKNGGREVDTWSLFKEAFRSDGHEGAGCFPGMEAMRLGKSAPLHDVTRTVFSDLMNFMRDKGLLVEPFKSSDGRNVFVRVSIIDAMCEEHALRQRMPLKTTASLLKALNIDQDEKIMDPAWFEFEQHDYKKWLKQIRKRMEGESAKTFELYQTYDEFDVPTDAGQPHKPGSLFRSVDRVSMIYDIIHEVINIQRLVDKGVITDVYPNHDDRRIEQFNSSWSSLRLLCDTRRQPLDAIRSYFGLHMAIWFAWQGHTLRTVLEMIPFSIVAFIILQVAKIGDFPSLGLAAHIGNVAMLMVFTIYYRKTWHRRENELKVRWGVSVAPTLEATRARPDYRGEKKESPWDRNKLRRTYPVWKTRLAQTGSVVIGVLWCLLVSAVVAVFLSPHGECRLRTFYPGKWQGTISGVLLSLQIKAFRMAWGYGVVPILVYWENPRTDQDYLDSLVYKLVPFNVINSYYSFFYVAFFKDKKGCTHDGDCGAELEDLLYSTYLTLACFNFVGLLWPLFQVWVLNLKDRIYQWKAERNGNEPARCKPVLEANADKPRISQADQQRDFLALVLELGYAILFGSAAPIIFVPCSVLLIIGVRLNAWKYTNIYQRERPYRITGIGAWGTVLDLLCGCGRISALAVAVFDLKELQFLSFSQKLLVIIVANTTVEILQMLADGVIGNFSSRTVLQILQRNYVERQWRTWIYAQEQTTRLPRALAKVKDIARQWKQSHHVMNLDDTMEDQVAMLDDREEGWTIRRKSRYWNTTLSEVGQ